MSSGTTNMVFWPCTLSPVPAIILATEEDLILLTYSNRWGHANYLCRYMYTNTLALRFLTRFTYHQLWLEITTTFLNLLKFLAPVRIMALLASTFSSSSCWPALPCTAISSGTRSTTVGADSIIGIGGGENGKPSCAYGKKEKLG